MLARNDGQVRSGASNDQHVTRGALDTREIEGDVGQKTMHEQWHFDGLNGLITWFDS